MVLGTVPYMSPEQVRGEALDARSDIFSFGCVLYESLTGKGAFTRPSMAETMAAILKDEAPSLVGTGGKLTSEWNELIKRCLEKDPNQRFQSSDELVSTLKAMS